MKTSTPPYTAALNDYVRGELGYENDQHYWILGGGVGRWSFGDRGTFPGTKSMTGRGEANVPGEP